MKEIRILISNLKQFPPNYFVLPVMEKETGTYGIGVFNQYGEQQGLIETGKDTKHVVTH